MSKDDTKNQGTIIQAINPWTLDTNKNFDSDEFKFNAKKELTLPPNLPLNEIKHILADIAAGDVKAAERPEFACLNFELITKALDWLMSSNALTDTAKTDLMKEPWRLNFKCRPPTPAEFTTEQYLGAFARESLWPHVREWFCEALDPIKAYRNLILCSYIGSGKSAVTILMYLYIATHYAMMYSPWRYFGQAQPLSQPIKKPDGSYVKMGDLKVGDLIAHPTEKASEVKEIKNWGKIPCYELCFSDGRKTKCSANHLWKVAWEKINNKWDWKIVTTQFIMDNPQHDYEFFEVDIDYPY
jgi:hypothetical protein